jgi:hypothetical protein
LRSMAWAVSRRAPTNYENLWPQHFWLCVWPWLNFNFNLKTFKYIKIRPYVADQQASI